MNKLQNDNDPRFEEEYEAMQYAEEYEQYEEYEDSGRRGSGRRHVQEAEEESLVNKTGRGRNWPREDRRGHGPEDWRP